MRPVLRQHNFHPKVSVTRVQMQNQERIESCHQETFPKSMFMIFFPLLIVMFRLNMPRKLAQSACSTALCSQKEYSSGTSFWVKF